MTGRTVWSAVSRTILRRGFPQPAQSRFFHRRLCLRRGQATLEMLIVLLFMIPLLFGAIELSRGVAIRAARCLYLNNVYVRGADWVVDQRGPD